MNNIIICSDGTWQPPESDTSTDILRIARGIAPESDTGNKQVVFYDWKPAAWLSSPTSWITWPRSPALRGLLERVGGSWDEIQVIFLPLNRKNTKKRQR
jgi:hypothetical protein